MSIFLPTNNAQCSRLLDVALSEIRRINVLPFSVLELVKQSGQSVRVLLRHAT